MSLHRDAWTAITIGFIVLCMIGIASILLWVAIVRLVLMISESV